MKPSLSDDFLKALGRITVNFQALEWNIAFLPWIMINRDTSIGQIITSQLSFRRLCNLSSSIFRYHVNDSSLVKRLEDLLAKAGTIEDQRNTIVHSVWFTDLEGAPSRLKFTAKLKQGFKVHSEDIDTEYLNSFATSILGVSDEFKKFFSDLHEAKIISSKPGIRLEDL